ncbi:sensor domain-containing diguanylate cyclase [bacterium]|nr:sensor domain-containing diguanylate cyclase [bacterium]
MIAKKLLAFFFSSLVLAATLCAAPGAGQAAKEAPPAAIDLGAGADLYFDADPALGIADMASGAFDKHFTPTAGRLLWVGREAPAAWLRFSIPEAVLAGSQPCADGAEVTPRQWLLVVKPSFSIILDRAALYVPKAGGGYAELTSGALAAERGGEPRSRNYVFELPASAFGGGPCYLRLASQTDVSLDLVLAPAIDYARGESVEIAAYCILYGILAAMLLYGTFLLFSLRDSAYLFYVLYIGAAGLWMFYVQGHAKYFFGPHAGFDQLALWFNAGAMLTWGAVFTLFFLRLKEGSLALYTTVSILACLGAVVSITGLAGWNEVAFSLSHYMALILPVAVIVCAVVRLIQGFRSALYYLIGWSALALSGIVFSLMGLKALPVNFFTVNVVSFGMAAQSVLLAMALSDRFKGLAAESEKIAAIEARYRELNFTDMLTGLDNRRHFMLELEKALSRARETLSPLSVAVLDVDDFKRFNDEVGRAAGDEVLIGMADLLKRSTRDGDVLCRFGGDEFAVMVPGIASKSALAVAERIRTRFAAESVRAMPSPDLEAGADAGPETARDWELTLSIGIAESDGKEAAEAFVERAERALREAKHHGKNRCAAL